MGPDAEECDLAVIGAGILGLAVARELQLRSPEARVVVVERERFVATHQTSHNSGVIHAGLYYRPGSLKAALCRHGAEALYEYCEQHAIPARRCGKLVIARTEHELPALGALERTARENGVPGIARVSPDQIREIEPEAAGCAGLLSPSTGVVDFALVARTIATEVQARGGTVMTGCEVRGARQRSRRIELVHSRGHLPARFAVFCGGAWSDRLARACGARLDLRIVPFRGAYLHLARARDALVRGLIYPVPDPRLPFLGVHLSRHVDDRVTIGPTALPVLSRTAYRLRETRLRDAAEMLWWPGSWRMARRWWRTGLHEIANAASRRRLVEEARGYVPALKLEDIEQGSEAGVRAQAVARNGTLLDDFVIARTERALHVCNAPSPAATAALALAGHIADQVESARS
jgi:L-2-hydroxyglutarate oxidase LhgO